MWRTVRAGIMFVNACVTGPCCTPLIVPVILAFLAGTPAAFWIGQNLGWVYGALTLLSVVSAVLGLRWMNRRSTEIGPIKSATTSDWSRPGEPKIPQRGVVQASPRLL